MNKSLLHSAINVAITGVLISGAIMSTNAYAGESVPESQTTEAPVSASNTNSMDSSSETYLIPGMGLGAAAGTIVAGPVGLVVGGLIGAIAGSYQENTETGVTADEITVQEETTNTDKQVQDVEDSLAQQDNAIKDESGENPEENSVAMEDKNNDSEKSIQLAQLGSINPMADDAINIQQEKLMNILVTDLSLDVYFRSGSSHIEKFYPARLAAIADLVKTMETLELHLDGYTDRRGNKVQNLALANERINKVREQLINAGVDEKRIISKAFGEAKMKSSAGNLEAYTFDRRVVIRFERIINLDNNATTALLPEPLEENTSITGSHDIQPEENSSPAVANASTQF